MKTLHLLFSSLLFIFSPCVICAWQTRDSLVLTQSETLRYATLVNDYFMRTYPDVGAKSYVGNKERTSKIWTRGVYYEGLMSLYRQHQDERWLKYTEDWGTITDGKHRKRSKNGMLISNVADRRIWICICSIRRRL